MSFIKCYTDASYCNETKIGIVCYDVYIDNICVHSEIHSYQKEKNSELEKIGIDKCIEYCETRYHTLNIIIYTDCKSNNKNCPNNISILWIKGHNKKSLLDENGLRFRNVDIRARSELKSKRLEFKNKMSKLNELKSEI